MTQERDDYMRRQEADHDLLRMRSDDLIKHKPVVQTARSIILEMAAAAREQEMWERRFRVLYAQHPIWRSADTDGSWGLRDFLRYAGEVCGFSAQRIEARSDETLQAAQPEGREPDGEADAPETKAVDPYALGGRK